MAGFPAETWALLVVSILPGMALAAWNAWRVRRDIRRTESVGEPEAGGPEPSGAPAPSGDGPAVSGPSRPPAENAR